MKYITLIVLTAFSCLLSSAQTFTIPAIPEKLNQQVKENLGKQRVAVEQQKNALKAELEAFNAKCTGVDLIEGDPLVLECNTAHDKLERSKQNFADALLAFKTELDNQISAYNPPPPLQAVTINSKGDFYAMTRDGKKLNGADNVPFDGTITFVTGNDGQVELKFGDGMVLSIGSNSTVVPEAIDYDEHNTMVKAIINLKKGVLHWVSSNVPGVHEKKLLTPMAVCTVRGTDFETSVNKEGSEQIKLFTGELEITETKTGRVFGLQAQQMVKCSVSGIFLKPVKLTE